MSIKLSSLITLAERLDGPNSNVDIALATLVGYRRKVEYISDDDGELGEPRVLWVFSSGGETNKVPKYTSSLDDALALVEIIAPDQIVGFSWDADAASAVVHNGTFAQSVTPALALCICALREKYAQDGDSEITSPATTVHRAKDHGA